MPRKPTVRYFDSRGAYYCQINGQQYRLATGPDDAVSGPTYLEALRVYRQLLEKGNVETAGGSNTVRVVLDAYMEDAARAVSPRTLDKKKLMLTPFVRELGEVQVGSLTHLQVYRFVDRMREPRKGDPARPRQKKRIYRWGDTTVSGFFDEVAAAFNWAVRLKLIPVNPLANVRRPHARSRSRDCIVDHDLHIRILAACRTKSARDIVVVLENTGARPGELAAAEGRDWNDALGAIVYYGDDRRRQDEFRHKTAGKGKDRVIRFTGEALDLARSAASRGTRTPLFPNSKGTAFGRGSIQARFKVLRETLGVPGLTPYSYRHTLSTRWLLAGRSIDVLAELLGNTPATIRKHYAHLCTQQGGIREQLESFMSQGGKNSDRPGFWGGGIR
jgi:integrase